MRKGLAILFLILTCVLFSCSEEVHIHSFDESIASKAASCTTEGEITYICSCGETLVVHTATLDHDLVVHQAKPATCTESGNTEYHTCSRCGYSTFQETPPLGHKFSDNWAIEQPATCTDAGSKVTNCIVCGTKVTMPVSSLGHSWGNPETTSPATCTQTGVKVFTCERCGTSKEEVIPALGHSYSSEWTVDVIPTCTAEGSKSHHCSRCDAKGDITAIEALGHDWNEGEPTGSPTCTATGSMLFTCSRCDGTREEVIPALGHNYVSEWTVDLEPNCDEAGSKSHHCSRCDSKSEITSIAALGHHYEYETLIEATCTTVGSRRGTCLVCGDVVIEEIPITHSFVANGADTICSLCGYSPESVYFNVTDGVLTLKESANLPTSFTIPSKIGINSISKIDDDTFVNKTGIVSVVISEGIINISNGAFWGCSSLMTVSLPNGLIRLGGSAFGATGLISVSVPESVTIVDGGVFQCCNSLTSVTFSSFNSGSISSNLFWTDGNLTEIRFRGTVAEWNALEKPEGWNEGVPATIVICSDGNADL